MDGHDERLRLPLWWWPVGLAVGGLLAAEIHLGYRGLRSWVPYVVLLPLVAGLLWWFGRLRIRVDGTELWVDDAHLPLEHIADVAVLRGGTKASALGPGLHALAFVIHRPWMPGAVKVILNDPADPTPYWIVSSRHPERLASVLIGIITRGGMINAPVGTMRSRQHSNGGSTWLTRWQRSAGS